MKVVLKSGTEIVVTKESSPFSLTIPSVDPTDVAAATEAFTRKNLSGFSLVDDSGTVVSEGSWQEVADVRSEDGKTTFTLRSLTDADKRTMELEEEIEIQAEAIQELAGIIAE